MHEQRKKLQASLLEGSGAAKPRTIEVGVPHAEVRDGGGELRRRVRLPLRLDLQVRAAWQTNDWVALPFEQGLQASHIRTYALCVFRNESVVVVVLSFGAKVENISLFVLLVCVCVCVCVPYAVERPAGPAITLEEKLAKPYISGRALFKKKEGLSLIHI